MSKVYSVSITCFLKCSVLIFLGGRKDSKEDNEDGKEDDEDRAGTEATEGEDFVVRQHAKVAELNIASGKLMLMLKLRSLLMLIIMLMLMLMSMLLAYQLLWHHQKESYQRQNLSEIQVHQGHVDREFQCSYHTHHSNRCHILRIHRIHNSLNNFNDSSV